jgi:hypothetical protein
MAFLAEPVTTAPEMVYRTLGLACHHIVNAR